MTQQTITPMHLVAFATLLLFQAPDTLDRAYASPATREVVERTIAASASPPAELRDYRARVQSTLYTALAPDSVGGGDLPASVDEVVSQVRWDRRGYLHQQVLGHRTRLLIPLPYTLATIMEQPWVLPHLYGSALYTPFAGPRAVNPFGPRGPLFYRYAAGDTVRIRVQDETVTLVPVEVRPRVPPSQEAPLLVLGTFFVDVKRDAVARARFGFVGSEGILPRSVGQLETFLEVDNALWQGRYWLPFQQRREVVFNSRVLGGRVAARVINRFVQLEVNTGWTPEGERLVLTWDEERGAFEDWRGDVGEDAGEFTVEDFADLRVATAVADPEEEGVQLQLHYERGSHLFRYNRVEGAFLGLGGRLIPEDPRRERWQVYGTAGWAFAEETVRGEIGVGYGAAVAPAATARPDWGVTAAAYRRLLDIQPFRPTYNWDWIYTLPAAFWGSDQRDYYDALGAEVIGSWRQGRWSARAGGRVEEHDSVRVNTQRFLFGEADEFGPLASVEPGTHVAVEVGGGYALGPGAFGIGNSAIVQGDLEVGVGDFRFNRITALLSGRYGLGPVTLAARVDGGHVWGGQVPPQKLFRFGSLEGLRGFEPNQFGGSTAVLARSRLLIGIPPRSNRPIARIGWFLIPPLRPSLALLGETGWTRIEPELRDQLAGLRAVPTGGARSSIGAGISILEDAFTIEYLHPVGPDADQRDGRWYVGLTYWY